MTKANEPAYPATRWNGPSTAMQTQFTGPTNRDKLAMEIYVRLVNDSKTDPDLATNLYKQFAHNSLRAADIFFEQLNK